MADQPNQLSASESKQVQQAKFKLFYDYINYDWSRDKAFSQEFEKAKGRLTDKRDEEEFKRKYYHKHINQDFELFFNLVPEERDAFLEFAKCQTDLESLDDIHNFKDNKLLRLLLHSKHFFYLVQFLLFPISLE
jgi:hypothetical protein